MTYKWSKDIIEYKAKTLKAFWHLIIPAISIYVVTTVLLEKSDVFLKSNLLASVLTLFFSSGVKFSLPLFFGGGYIVNALGMPWFLVVLFFARSIYDYLQMKISKRLVMIICIFLSFIGAIISKYIWLPFSFDIVLAIMLYLYIGANVCINKNTDNRVFKCTMAFIIWVFTLLIEFYFTQNYLELASREYVLFPLCHITAIAGTLFICGISNVLEKKNSILCYLGRHSLYIFCIHALDKLWKPLYNMTCSDVANCMFRLMIDLLIFVMIIWLKKQVDEKYKKGI